MTLTHLQAPPAPAKPNLLLHEALELVKTAEPVVFDGTDGQPVAALISIEDLRFYEKLFEEEEDRVDNAACDRAREEIEAGRAELIPWDEAKKRLAAIKD